ncbi:Chaperone DnaJ-domain superfamily protein [Striga hermonthica]|uniref:Chaperone DnaJ-domain superfamily protein n=1 Tax=Striga hermonthica TaxID=68872 RepID=A0A9N7NPI8_STRHE|nr:Chaperone DnaJ-domain superfamily protein [Striga hermonthica]
MGTHAPKLPNHPPRRSTGDTSSHHRTTLSGEGHLNPEDFADVFGGPPRTVLSRRFGGGIPRSASPSSSSADFSFEDAFRRTEAVSSGRKFSQFKIPFGKQRSFYGDIFGWENSNNNSNNKVDDESVVRSRSRSKASSSSALSSEDLSPLRPAISDGGYDDVYLFGSKLRPINVPSRWNSGKPGREKCRSRPFREANYNNRNISEIDFFEYMKNRPLEPSRKKNASPEPTNTEPILSSDSFEKSDDERKFNSPVSSSSTCRSETGQTKTRDYEINDDNDDESMSSLIEFDLGKGEWTFEETNGVDEAIAWVKEKSHKEKSTKEIATELQLSDGQTETFQSLIIIDEKIKLWSTGKEADIRMLLSSMHHVRDNN